MATIHECDRCLSQIREDTLPLEWLIIKASVDGPIVTAAREPVSLGILCPSCVGDLKTWIRTSPDRRRCHDGQKKRGAMRRFLVSVFLGAIGALCYLAIVGCSTSPQGLDTVDAGVGDVTQLETAADILAGEVPTMEPDAAPDATLPAADAGEDVGRVGGHGCDAFTASCGPGLRCDSTCDVDPPRICNPSKGIPIGGACADHDDCEAGSICPAAPAGVCRKLCGLGHDCPAGQTCNLGWCPEGVGYCT